MICPACGTNLSATRVADVEIDLCPSCGGVWLDNGELETLMQIDREGSGSTTDWAALRAPAPEGRAPVQYRKCPRCQGWMRRHNHENVSGVIVDQCAQHGLWLDKGEYGALATWESDERNDERGDDFEKREREYVARLRKSVRDIRYVNRRQVQFRLWELF